jgi:hypothetical protein
VGSPFSLSAADYETTKYEKDPNKRAYRNANFRCEREGAGWWGIIGRDRTVYGVGDIYKRALEESAV